jgi:hypothetical protein
MGWNKYHLLSFRQNTPASRDTRLWEGFGFEAGEQISLIVLDPLSPTHYLWEETKRFWSAQD